MKKLIDLINLEEPGWNLVQEWLKDASNNYEILVKDKKRAEQELVNVQVTTHSPMGAVIYETGGILIDFGWIRILGSGSSKLDRGLSEWNKGKTFDKIGDRPTFLLIADDIIGGYFALNAGGIGSEIGNVYYLAQDTLEWEDLGCGYSGFLNWTLTGDIQKFYELFKWENWKVDIANLNGNQTFSFFPFLWTEEGKNINKVDRKVVPTEENYNLTMDMKSQLDGK